MEAKTEKSAPETVTVVVNGEEKQFPKGMNLLKALLDSGNHVPHYCWHPSLSVAGNCRLCMVQIEGQPRPAVSCNMTCTDGLKIETESEVVLDAREGMMEFLLQNHPLDCPICDRGGECMLQRYSMEHGTGTARTVDTRRRFEKPQFDPLIDIERNRCIMCTRCVRFTDEEAGEHVLGVFGRGDRNYIGTEGNGPVSNIFSGNIIDICPVGCLTSKPFRFKARPWEMQQVNSTCTLCSAGCETTAWIRDGQVLRVTPPVRKYGQQFTIDEDTERFICNEGRFGNMYANSTDRLRKAFVRKGDKLEAGKLIDALAPAAEALKQAAAAGPEKVALLSGTRVTNEEFYLLSRLARVALGTHQIDWRLDYLSAAGSKAVSAAMGASDGDLDLLKTKAYGATLFIGSDLKETIPVTGLDLRDAARHGQTELYMIGSRLDGWLSPVAKGSASVKPEVVGSLIQEIAAHIGGTKKSRKKDVLALADGLKSAQTGLIVLSLDEAGGMFAPDRVDGVLALLRALGEGWKFVPVFHGRNAKGAYAAGAQSDRLASGAVGDEAASHLMAELWGEVKAKGEESSCAIEILERAAEGKIETLLLHRPDELVHHPRRALIEKALDATPNVIVIDVFPSWISEKASVVLPGALFFEVEGTLLAADGTINALMQANQPPGEAQEDWRIIDTLCDMLGAPSRYNNASDVFADLARCWGLPPRTRLRDFWLEGPGFESPQRPQPAIIRKKTRPDFKVHFGSRDALEETSQAEAGEKDGLRLLFGINAQGDDHLGSRCTEFAELRPDRRIELNPKDIKKLNLTEGGKVKTEPGHHVLTLEANESIPVGIAYAAANVLGLEWEGGATLPALTLNAMEGELMDTIDTLVIPTIKAAIVFGSMVLAMPVMVLVERKIIGRIQQRPGPNRVGIKSLVYRLQGKEIPKGKAAFGFWGGELQTIIDGVKLLLKEDLIPKGSDRALFILAPMITLVPALLSIMIVPIGPVIEMEIAGQLRTISLSATDLPIGILFYLAISSVGVYGIMIAGWASNSKYSLLGGVRSAAQLISYEITMALSLIGVILIVGSFNLREIVGSQDGGFWTWHLFRQPIGCLFFLVAGFAETNRLPFDLPEGETELGAGFHTEYSSMKWALFMMAEYFHILTFAAIMTTMFLGGFHGPLAPPPDMELPALAAAASGFFWFTLKVSVLFFFFVLVRGTLPRLRYDQLMSLGWKVMFPIALLNVVVTAGILALGLSTVATGVCLFAAGCGIIFVADRFAQNAKEKVVGYAS